MFKRTPLPFLDYTRYTQKYCLPSDERRDVEVYTTFNQAADDCRESYDCMGIYCENQNCDSGLIHKCNAFDAEDTSDLVDNLNPNEVIYFKTNYGSVS